ncbi:MAG: PIG-L deacetylase family protein [Microbacteriaceae bacterium]
MSNGERVVFVHAHPDDESITTGGTIATLIDSGAHVTVITATRGERGASSDLDNDLDGDLDGDSDGDSDDHLATIANRRDGELAEALRILGVTDHRYLGETGARWQDRPPRRYVDSGTRADQARADSLVSAPFGEISSDIAAVIDDTSPTVVVSYNEWGGHGHPDHIRIHQAARRAAEVMNVAFYAIEPEGSAATPMLATDVSAVLDRKSAAIAAHASRHTVDGGDIVSVQGAREPIASMEYFRRIREPEQHSFSWRELSLTTRISTAVLALVLGGATGLLMTAAHQSTLVIGDFSLPWGIVVALVCSTALIAGFRIAFDTRVLPALAAFGLLGVAAILASPTRGGSVVVPANLAGMLWTFVPPAVTFIVLAWPRIRRAPVGRIDVVPAVKGPSQP